MQRRQRRGGRRWEDRRDRLRNCWRTVREARLVSRKCCGAQSVDDNKDDDSRAFQRIGRQYVGIDGRQERLVLRITAERAKD